MRITKTRRLISCYVTSLVVGALVVALLWEPLPAWAAPAAIGGMVLAWLIVAMILGRIEHHQHMARAHAIQVAEITRVSQRKTTPPAADSPRK